MPIGLVVVIIGLFGQLGWSWHLADIERVRLEITRQQELKSLRLDMDRMFAQIKELRLKTEYANRRLDTAGIKEK